MPSAVVTTSSTVTCGHRGTVSTVGTLTLRVAGNAVLVASGIVNKAIAGCTIPVSSGSGPCLTVSGVISSTLSTKLMVGGNPVALAGLKGSTNGTIGGTTIQPLLSATVMQTKLMAT